MPPGETPFSLLFQKSIRGLLGRCRPVTPGEVRRLARELSVIEPTASPPTSCWWTRSWPRRGGGGMRHVGRGSAANSLVSYLLGFTAIDPLAHNLLFERFMNPARTSPPDIDLDFSWRERDGLIDWVFERYGDDRVAMIGTHVTFGPAGGAARDGPGHGPAAGGDRPGDPPGAALGRRVAGRPAGARSPSAATCRSTASRGPASWRWPSGSSASPATSRSTPAGSSSPRSRWRPGCRCERAAGGWWSPSTRCTPSRRIGLIKIDLLSQRSLGVLEDVPARR